MPIVPKIPLPAILMSIFFPLLTGCGFGNAISPTPGAGTLPSISGHVHGGEQPVSNSVIQLYAVNVVTNEGASEKLISSTVTTDSLGNFVIGTTSSKDYSCPSPDTLVYITATGGNPGLNGPVNNAAIALTTLIGTCSTLTSATALEINELTTAVGIASVAPFMADLVHLGADPADVEGLAAAFANAASIVDPATGQFVVQPTSASDPLADYNALADVLAACVNTNGDTSAGSICGKLFGYTATSPSADVSLAMLHIMQAPYQNAPQILSNHPVQVPYLPLGGSILPFTTTALPSVFPANDGYLLAIDKAQQIWIYTPGSLGYGSPNVGVGKLTVYDNLGKLLHTITEGTGGLSDAVQLEADTLGNVWALNGDGSLSKFSSTGTALSPAGGFTDSPNPDPLGVQGAMAIDPTGHVWISPGYSLVTGCYTEYANDGSVLADGSSSCPVENGQTFGAYGLASDGSGNLFFNANYFNDFPSDYFLVERSSSGSTFTAAPGFPLNGGFNSNTQEMTYDRKFNQIWASGDGEYSAVTSTGTLLSPTSGFPLTGLGATSSFKFATDGDGKILFGGDELTTSFTGWINFMDHSGNILTPTFNQTPTPGIQVPDLQLPGPIAVDNHGTVWVADQVGHLLYRLPGLASPKNYQ